MSSGKSNLKRPEKAKNDSSSASKFKQQRLTSFFSKLPEPQPKTLDSSSSECQQETQQSSSSSTSCDVQSIQTTDPDCSDKININQKIQPTDLSSTQDDSPAQPDLKQFPFRSLNGKLRRFSSKWYKSYPFLEYSVQLDMVFCFSCRHFSTKKGSSSLVDGCSDWKNLGAVLSQHFLSSPDHLFSNQKYLNYQQTKNTGGVASQINSHDKEMVLQNRSILAAHIESVLFCARQGIALQGHEGNLKEPGNHGNFLELLELMKRKNPELKRNSDQLPSNSKYVHSTIQNEMINSAASIIRKMIVKEVNKEGGKFSVIADETRDSAGKEQLSVCIRYIFDSEIKERFLGFLEMEKFDAKSISDAIIQIIGDSGLNLKNCVAQAYDGASVMSGDINGTHTRIEQEVGGFCPYVHCHAHKLNLVLVDSCSSVKEIRELLGLLQAIYNFQSNSTRRSIYFQRSQEEKGDVVLKIPQSCDTRWSSKKKGISYFKSRMDSVLQAFETIIKEGKADEVPQCQGFLYQLKSFKSTLMLVIMDKVLSITNSMSTFLQSEKMTLSAANLLSSATIKTLTDIRNESEFEKLLEEAGEICVKCQISIPEKNPQKEKRQKQVSTRLRSSVVMETTGVRDECSGAGDYRRVYFEIIDKFVNELKERFSKNDDLHLGVGAAEPSSPDFLSESAILKFCNLFSRFLFDQETIRSEISVAKNMLKSEGVQVQNTSDIYNLLLKLKSSFPNLLNYYYIANLIPVANCSSERSFSALKRIKTRLRSTMSEDRTSNLALISIERDLSDIIYKNPDLVVDEFARAPNRRLELIL